ncbi:tripartite tricarboxylate transporter substrate binding protein [Orrella sp. JC864]|uniref:Bug family tripartite tricarboxylate transporter substrate binding protein n=1 Tax=Orrella sp. JC864 TaxID=3120298 RepID=UPI0012BD41E4
MKNTAPRRAFGLLPAKGLRLAAALLCAPALAFGAAAQDYPSKPVRIVVPYAPGGATDILARLVGKQLGNALGQPMIVENMAGGNTAIAAANVARAAPDGYTLMFTNDATFVLNPALQQKLSYDIKKDFVPVGTVCYLNLGLAVSTRTPAQDLKSLAAYTREQGDKLAYGSFGVGSHPHLMGEMYNQVTGSKLIHVPYKGSAPAVTDVVGQQILMTFPALATVQGHIASGNVKILAISGEERSPLLPEVPTFDELGYKELNIGSWYAFFAPAGTPQAIVTRINEALAKVLQDPDFREQLIKQGTQPTAMTPAELDALIDRETERTRQIARIGNIKME